MKDKVEIYNLASEMVTMDTPSNFYSNMEEEFYAKGSFSRKVKTVLLVLMNPAGEIYVQKRAENKIQGMGKYDKTVGGHVIVGDPFERALVIECGKELGIPSAVESPENFKEKARSSDLKQMAVCREIDYLPDFLSKKILSGGEKLAQPYMTTIYIGYYDGEINFINGKKSIIEKYSLEDLMEILEENPYEVTHDLKFILNNYENFLVPLYS